MSENLDDYQVTPSDLGQDPGLDEGVLEEAITSGSSEPEKPVSKCFQAIPFAARKKYRQLYDAFDKKDMTFEDFATEMHFISSPGMMRQDLKDIIDQRHQGNRRMAANLHNINKNLN